MKPEFWTDQKLGLISRDARLLAIAMLNFADDRGRLTGNSKVIKGHVFPFDDDLTSERVTGLLRELVDIHYLQPYDANGETYYEIRNFQRHQFVKNPSRHGCPPPGRTSPTVDMDQIGSTSGGCELGKGSRKGIKDLSSGLTPVRTVVERFKTLKGYVTTNGWDRVHYPRCAKAASLLLAQAASPEEAVAALEGVAAWATKEGLEWTLETVVKRYPDWAKGKPAKKMTAEERDKWNQQLAALKAE